MPTGNLKITISDLLSNPLERPVDIEVRRDPGPNGAGGGNLDYTFEPEGTTTALLKDLPTRGGPGSRHTFRFFARGYVNVAFMQFVEEGDRDAVQRVYMVRDPKQVKSISAPAFPRLPKKLQTWLNSAQMIALAKEDEDLKGKSGPALYDALGDQRKAAVLNIFRKATHTGTVAGIWDFIREPMVIRPDRCFVRVDQGLTEFVSKNELFVTAPKTLHRPLEGYTLSNSVKSDDAHANIQLTFQRAGDGAFAADVDIDEHSGFEHWGEVLRNFFSQKRTSPYAIHELLLAADLSEHTLDPGYDLQLK